MSRQSSNWSGNKPLMNNQAISYDAVTNKLASSNVATLLKTPGKLLE